MLPAEFSMLDFFFTPLAWKLIARRLQLTPRELQILRGIFQDRKEATIASRLRISPHTVRTHLERIYAKLGLDNRVELIMLVTATFLCITAMPSSKLAPICGKRSSGRCPFSRRP